MNTIFEIEGAPKIQKYLDRIALLVESPKLVKKTRNALHVHARVAEHVREIILKKEIKNEEFEDYLLAHYEPDEDPVGMILGTREVINTIKNSVLQDILLNIKADKNTIIISFEHPMDFGETAIEIKSGRVRKINNFADIKKEKIWRHVDAIIHYLPIIHEAQDLFFILLKSR